MLSMLPALGILSVTWTHPCRLGGRIIKSKRTDAFSDLPRHYFVSVLECECVLIFVVFPFKVHFDTYLSIHIFPGMSCSRGNRLRSFYVDLFWCKLPLTVRTVVERVVSMDTLNIYDGCGWFAKVAVGCEVGCVKGQPWAGCGGLPQLSENKMGRQHGFVMELFNSLL